MGNSSKVHARHKIVEAVILEAGIGGAGPVAGGGAPGGQLHDEGLHHHVRLLPLPTTHTLRSCKYSIAFDFSWLCISKKSTP